VHAGWAHFFFSVSVMENFLFYPNA